MQRAWILIIHAVTCRKKRRRSVVAFAAVVLALFTLTARVFYIRKATALFSQCHNFFLRVIKPASTARWYSIA